MLVGALGYFRFFPGERFPGPIRALGMLRAGAGTFLAAMPLLVLTSLAWRALLQLLGLPAERQALVDLFQQAESGPLLALLIAIAVGLAPITEEIVFRAGLFRYARTRLPRALALLAPAILFAALHANLSSFAPLVVLAVVFSLAYERTGSIGVPIIAHGLFNLNTVVLILSGAVDLA
jgi:membrane protease YdiL (CAAX protease family)